MAVEFTWRDGERTIVFKDGALADVVDALRWHGWDRYELLTTTRALNDAPLHLPGHAAAVHEVLPVPSTRLRRPAQGGRFAGAGRARRRAGDRQRRRGARRSRGGAADDVSGAEMISIHKLPDGHSACIRSAHSWCGAEPATMTGLDEPKPPCERDECPRARRRLALHARQPGGRARRARGEADRYRTGRRPR